MIVPQSDHNMHMDNPIAFANLMINDILFASGQIKEALPVLNVDQYAEMGYSID